MSCTIGSRATAQQSMPANIIIRQKILPANFVDNSIILYYCYCFCCFFSSSFCCLFGTLHGGQQCMVGICHTEYSLLGEVGRITSGLCIRGQLNESQTIWLWAIFFFFLLSLFAHMIHCTPLCDTGETTCTWEFHKPRSHVIRRAHWQIETICKLLLI